MKQATSNQEQGEMSAAYSIEEAKAIWQPFRPGAILDLICRVDSTFAEFAADPENWLAQEHQGKRYRYTSAEMSGLWKMIEAQKRRTWAWTLVNRREYPAFDPAMRAIQG